jgi:hypothetical protein
MIGHWNLTQMRKAQALPIGYATPTNDNNGRNKPEDKSVSLVSEM